MFGIDTGEEIPKSYLTDHDVWDDYVGQVWYSLLHSLDSNLQAPVIEIGPGTAAKIGHALKHFSYSGELYVVDASRKVLEILKPKYKALLPHAKITWINASLESSLKDLPRNAGFFLASHLMDDMLLYHDQSDAVMSWAETYTHAPAVIVRKAWDEIRTDAKRLSSAKSAVQSSILRSLEVLKPHHAVLSQYPSSTLHDNGMGSLNEQAHDVLDQIRRNCKDDALPQAQVQQVLSTHKNYKNAHIGEHVLNAKYWMVCRQKNA